ncbi:MAG: alpha/beta fold hydrolase [Phycisphaerales bacterium]|nr:alpha/beta fold hydrolase [Phycisphaerales bacterium]
MQRPVMNPDFAPDPIAPAPRRRWGLVARRLFRRTTSLLLMDVIPRRHKHLRIEEGTLPTRIFRGVLYRLAFWQLCIGLLVGLSVAITTHPQQVKAGLTPQDLGIYYEPVTMLSEDQTRLEGVLIPALDARRVLEEKDKILRKRFPAVVLVHDLGGSSEQMLPLVKPLHNAGLVVLVLDLRGCGNSAPGGQTFGLNESKDVQAAVQMLRRRSYIDPDRIAIIGSGTGANAALLASLNDPAIAALVLERPACDPQQLMDRFILRTPALKFMQPLYRWAFEVAYGVNMDDLRPDRFSEIFSTGKVLTLDKPGIYNALSRDLTVEQISLFLHRHLNGNFHPSVVSNTL